MINLLLLRTSASNTDAISNPANLSPSTENQATWNIRLMDFVK